MSTLFWLFIILIVDFTEAHNIFSRHTYSRVGLWIYDFIESYWVIDVFIRNDRPKKWKKKKAIHYDTMYRLRIITVSIMYTTKDFERFSFVFSSPLRRAPVIHQRQLLRLVLNIRRAWCSIKRSVSEWKTFSRPGSG